MEKPILFNTEMVKAILEGRKTCTRRIVKPQPKQPIPLGFVVSSTNSKNEGCFGWGKDKYGGIIDYAKPPYRTGDILYVRETWKVQSLSNVNNRAKFLYKAKPNDKLKETNVDGEMYIKLLKYEDKNGWHPSIFMPKEAARIFLKVTDVRNERLRDITEESAKTEGINPDAEGLLTEPTSGYRRGFRYTWNKLYNNWNENPWVWVIEFEKLDNYKI